MKVWYCPSWNGDWRLEADPKAPDTRTRLSVVKPTAAELAQLKSLTVPFRAKGWLNAEDAKKLSRKPKGFFGKDHVVLSAPLSEVGPFVTSLLRPGPAVLTAVKFSDGRVEVCDAGISPKTELLPPPATPPALDTETGTETGTEPQASPPSSPSSREATVLASKPGAETAVTVKRPTPCCPDCYVDAVGPATEALLSFMDGEQHASWAKNRFLIARGGVTGHRYLLAHRHSPQAATQTRIALDMEDGLVVHFHDWTVPPEEEVLAAKLILEHRESWLRNEATSFHGQSLVFKNPFGDGVDGVADAIWTQRVGRALLPWVGGQDSA